ncbi:hypothetical protein KJ909_00205 [Patescibacteria group bacterium]|nr:hypothetical protein [Patescibacteria group bacterium]
MKEGYIYNPEQGRRETNLDMVTGYLEGVAGFLKGEDLKDTVRTNLVKLLELDLKS